MNTHARKPLSTGWFQAGLVLILLLALVASQAQTFFGSGGPKNSATDSTNVALGYDALRFNTKGEFDTAIGEAALYHNSTGDYNTATGLRALFSNRTGAFNVATGVLALGSNTAGRDNTAIGAEALQCNTTGRYNTAIGCDALIINKTGSSNIAFGFDAGSNLTTGSNNIDIGNNGRTGEGGTIRIGSAEYQTAAFIAGIHGVTAVGGAAVYINASGQLGTLPSSRRFKMAIHTMADASDHLMQLRPVTFRYKQAAENGDHPLQYGLIAEEVAKVYPDLVQYDKAGKPYAVYYQLLTPMLLNELQKAHHAAEAQTAEIAALQSEVAYLKRSQQEQLKALTRLTALVEEAHNTRQRHRVAAMQH